MLFRFTLFYAILFIILTTPFRSLSGPDKTGATVLLRLFKLVFSAIPLFPENESVLQPHLATIITSSIKYPLNTRIKKECLLLHVVDMLLRLKNLSTTSHCSAHYLGALVAESSIYSWRNFYHFFQVCYRMILFIGLLLINQIVGLLEILNKLQNSSHSATLKELFVELSLTVPVRLSLFLPCLPLLVKPLVLALESNSELVLIISSEKKKKDLLFGIGYTRT